MAKERTLESIEADKEKINDLHAELTERTNKERAELDSKWEALDEEWFDVRHASWDQDLIEKAKAKFLNLKSYSTEEQLKSAVEGN